MPDIIRFIKNTQRSFALAKALFPEEKWVLKSLHIWIAKSRLSQKKKELKKWKKEMSQVKILTRRGCVAFFLPEKNTEGEAGLRCADTVIDGEIVELKTVTGTRATLSKDFKKGYKQGASLIKNLTKNQSHSVFVRLFSELSIDSVKAKIAGELKTRYDDGYFICYFEHRAELHTWTYKELRSIIGKK